MPIDDESDDLRTVEQVLWQQNSIVGCCNRHADQQACDCLLLARNRAALRADVKILYRNHRGIVAVRHIKVVKWYFGEVQWHPGHQWLLEATDLDKGEMRTFAMADVLAWGDKAIKQYYDEAITFRQVCKERQDLLAALENANRLPVSHSGSAKEVKP